MKFKEKPKKNDKVYMYGKHALMEALLHVPHAVKKVFFSPDLKEPDLQNMAAKLRVPAGILKEKDVRGMVSADAAHQGVIAVLDSSALMMGFEDFLASVIPAPSKHTSLVLLDELTDPHNVGAIIRSAAAFGVAGVLIPSHRQAPVTGAVVKASAGMVFRIPLVTIGNVNHTLRVLKEKGFWVYGLAMEGAHDVSKEVFDAPAVFVVGNEGKGIREKTLELSDITLSIPIHSRCESLNAAASAAVVLYEWGRGHREAFREAGKEIV